MDRDFSRSLAVLIGNGSFADRANLPEIPAAACVTAMAGLLTSELCGWPAERILVLQDLASFPDVARRLVSALRDVHGVLLVYYVGHGVRTRKGQLALALGETDANPQALPHTAMLYESLADLMGGCPAATKLVILDCCHAELANKASFQSADLAETYPVDGLYFIGASKTHEKAKYDPLGGLTYFTEAFVETVRSGIEGLPEELRLDQIFLQLRARLVSDGLPEPVDAGVRGARQYPFARNAWNQRPVADEGSADPARAERLRILSLAEQDAVSIGGGSRTDPARRRVLAMLRVARALLSDDADQARRLAARAVRVASTSATARREVAAGVAPVDPDRAHRIADALGAGDRDKTLASISKNLAKDEPEHAQRFAEAIVDEGIRSKALQELAKSVAPQNPDMAERIAGLLPEPSSRALVLHRVAKAVVETDFPRATSICDSIIALGQPWAVSYVVEVIALIDPAAAETRARQVSDERYRAAAYGHVAKGYARLASQDTERVLGLIPNDGYAWYVASYTLCDAGEARRAARVARGIRDPQWRASALLSVAWKVPEGEMRTLVEEAERAARLCRGPDRDRSLKEVADKATQVDVDYAVRLAHSISDADDRALSLNSIACSVAPGDPRRAEQVAHGITGFWQVSALTEVARHWQQAHDSTAARRVLETAHKTAGRIALPHRASALARIAAAAAPLDPSWARRLLDQAETVAYTIEDEGHFGPMEGDRALKEIVLQVGLRSPREARQVLARHAERIARAIPNRDMQADALAALACEVFPDDPERAERLILGINHVEHRIEGLIKIAAMHKSPTSAAR